MTDLSLPSYEGIDSVLHLFNLHKVEVLSASQPTCHLNTWLYFHQQEHFLVALADRLERLDQMFLLHLAQ